ncbi:hypothetical protein BXZ70DRAFT_1052744 [Cristinia sonorae]|uniref:Uncharacterized protein n=1 Tax=Cristinia sonorae TaxID=1940300 RepID=A0A8K0UVG9_9AGAR|nr:hypothetical protein BXZ70DRAFT_1052744 [Cristinia sonorae]
MSSASTALAPSNSAARNPFRNRPLSPNRTGLSTTGSDSSSDEGPEDPTSRARSGLSQPAPNPANGPSISITDSANDPLSEELPPAYTAAPDMYSGEQTVEYGPRRPFQAAPPPVVQPQPQMPGPWQTPQSTGWTGYPGQGGRVQSHVTGSSYISSRPSLVPPPTHPLSAPRATSMPPMPVPTVTSEFARDFYSAGPDTSVLGGTSEQYTAGSSSYDPPPLPPRTASSSVSGHSRGQSEGGTSSQHRGAAQISDDGTPTTTPVPGHPLLYRGNVLVYPTGHECSKCHNTGYKHYDPGNPCKKCWNKYSKEYSGAMTYTTWNASGSTTSEGGKVFQKPLPKFSPPHQPAKSFLTRPAVGREGLAAHARPTSGYPGAASHSGVSVLPIPGGGIPMAPYLSSTQQYPSYGRSGPVVTPGSAPPGAVVYRPGDPRIGGHLCWRCGGDGKVSFFLFDSSPCGICNGIGRTF